VASKRSGTYRKQPGGYLAFIPNDLPLNPPIDLDPRTQVLLSEADRAVGRLDASTQLLPNPDLFVAMYVPPPPEIARTAMGALETFFHSEDPLPPLVQCALSHSQFESIHPFLDGNGRVGRLLITFLLCWKETLKQPLLYLSDYFKRNRDEYYQSLQEVRDKDNWEGWIEFFLQGVKVVALDAGKRAGEILELRESHRSLVAQHVASSHAHALLDRLFQKPVISVNAVVEFIGRSYPTANQLVSDFERLAHVCHLCLQVVENKRSGF
jgi:Fic family protein